MLRPYQLFAIAAVLSAPAQAEPTNCFVMAAAAEATARERDSGTPPEDAAHEVNAFATTVLKVKLNQSALGTMIDTIYDAPEVTREQVYSRVLEQCVALTVTH